MSEPTLVELESLHWMAGLEYVMDELHDRFITIARFYGMTDDKIVDFMNSLRRWALDPEHALDKMLEQATLGWIVKIGNGMNTDGWSDVRNPSPFELYSEEDDPWEQ